MAIASREMAVLDHFIHKHPLTYHYVPEDENHIKCSICGLPILSSPSYKCIISGCRFSVHKPCAQLPQQIEYAAHRTHGSSSSLLLKAVDESPSSCTYSCSDCEFKLHPLRAKPVKIEINHESHQSHPLVAIRKEILCLCNACGEEHKGFFFSCSQECDFWIHVDCLLLPKLVKLTSYRDPLVLTYALSDFVRGSKCVVCSKSDLLCDGLYFSCGNDNDFAHPNCAKSKMEELKPETTIPRMIELPNEEGMFPSLVIRRAVDSMRKSYGDDNKYMISLDHIHNHPFLLQKHVKHDDDNGVTCNACMRPIISSSKSQAQHSTNYYYKCSASPECEFFIHDLCASLPANAKDIKGKALVGSLHHNAASKSSSSATPDQDAYFFCYIFPCRTCWLPCNGFCYANSGWLTIRDVECACVPYTITHAAHGPDHILFYYFKTPKNVQLSCCDDKASKPFHYRCASCDRFCIHVKCALLPKRVHHRFDKHPLKLITNRNIHEILQDDQEYFFCEVCEEDVDRRYWFYHCAECEQCFHVKCIPSVGFLSKVKFGGTLKLADEYDKHRVVLTRMLMEGSHRCGYCKKIIHGFVDTMAFHCSKCHFWIHFTCARKCAASVSGGRSLKFFWEYPEGNEWNDWVKQCKEIWNIE